MSLGELNCTVWRLILHDKIPFFTHKGASYNIATIGSITAHAEDETMIYFHGGGQLIIEKSYREVLEILKPVTITIEL